MSVKAINNNEEITNENIEELTKQEYSMYITKINFFKNDYYFTDSINKGNYDVDIIKNFLHPLISESEFILDIGAHAGTHTISYSTINPNTTIYSFEPQKKMFNLLKYNIEQNELNNVKLFNNVVGHENNKKVFLNSVITDGPNNNKKIEYGTDNNFNLGGVSLGKDGEESKMITIDSMKLNKCDFVKIDVEGFEKHVLMGSIETFTKYKPIIFFECNQKEKESKGVYDLDEEYDEMSTFEFIFKKLNYKTIISVGNHNYLAMYKVEDFSKLSLFNHCHPMSF